MEYTKAQGLELDLYLIRLFTSLNLFNLGRNNYISGFENFQKLRLTMYKNNIGFSSKLKRKSLKVRYYSYTSRYPTYKTNKKIA
jgi:hypothetical protein